MSKSLLTLSNERAHLNVPTGTIGSKLEYTLQPRSAVEQFLVDDQYQRIISNSNLKKQGKLNWTYMHPLIVANRPKSLGSKSGFHVIDGQHKGVKYLQSETEDACPCLVLNHPEDRSYDDCLEVEAKVFSALNTLRKKLNKLEEIRAGVIWKEPEAIWVQNVLQTLDLVVDGSFGSDKDDDDTLELKGFYQFWFLCCDYRDELGKIIAGYGLWKLVYGKNDIVNGTCLRAMVFLKEFIDECLTNGKRDNFFKFVTEELPKQLSQDALVKPFTDRKSNRYVLYSILDRYQQYCEASGVTKNYRIGSDTMSVAITNFPKFKDPKE